MRHEPLHACACRNENIKLEPRPGRRRRCLNSIGRPSSGPRTDSLRTDPAPVLFARAHAQPQAQRVAHAAEGERACSAPTRQQAQQEEW